MFGATLVVFRETVEAALLIGIIAAATRGIPGRSDWIFGGVLTGATGAALVAALTGHISALLDGIGQELFNAAILAVAVILLAWHNIWMSGHAAELAASAKQVGREVGDGKHQLSAILAVIAVAVLREGSESVLFLYGLMASGEVDLPAVAGGGVLGVLAGGTLGLVLYAGMLKIPMRWFFSVTGALILLLAAAMASQLAKFLIQADVLPSLSSPLWDTSAALSNRSPLGTLMHALAGYDATPAGMQVLFYVLTALAIVAGMWWARRSTVRSIR
jgi:high-affinity iron transporter